MVRPPQLGVVRSIGGLPCLKARFNVRRLGVARFGCWIIGPISSGVRSILSGIEASFAKTTTKLSKKPRSFSKAPQLSFGVVPGWSPGSSVKSESKGPPQLAASFIKDPFRYPAHRPRKVQATIAWVCHSEDVACPAWRGSRTSQRSTSFWRRRTQDALAALR
jgi:hypothetical protein